MSACAGSSTDAFRSDRVQVLSVAGIVVCGPRTIQDCFGLQEQDFTCISPARIPWIAPGRIGFMSTQRRESRSAPATGIGRNEMRDGSRLAEGKDRAIRSKQAGATTNFPAHASDRTARTAYSPAVAARITLHQDDRNQQLVRLLCPGSPPMRLAAAHRPFFDRPSGSLLIASPAIFARVH